MDIFFYPVYEGSLRWVQTAFAPSFKVLSMKVDNDINRTYVAAEVRA
jgi:hypothetical protein